MADCRGLRRKRLFCFYGVDVVTILLSFVRSHAHGMACMLLVSIQVHPRLYDGDAPIEDALQPEGLSEDEDPKAEGQP